MNKNLIKAAVISLAIASPFQAFSASVTSDASVTIVSAITIAENQSLDFGSILQGTVGSNAVTVATDGSRAIVVGTGDAALEGSTSQQAQYDVTSTTGATVDIEVNNIVSNGAGITLNPDFTCSVAGGADQACDTGDGAMYTSGGVDTIDVGGVLDIDNTVATAGTFTSTFDFVANYQ